MVSSPVRTVMAGEALRYRVVASDPSASFEGIELPDGATLDTAGNFFWTPAPAQSGPRRVAVKVKAGDEEVTQAFNVVVSTASRQRTQAVDPNAPEATSITVDAPLSPIRGAGVQIEPGSLIGTEELTVSISAVENAPLPPSAVVRGVPLGNLKPVELGPSGTAFRKAARVQLPYSADLLGVGEQPEVLTIDPVSGAWEKVKILEVDREQNIVTAEIEHFSTYVVAPAGTLLEGKLSLGAAGTACARSLIVRAALIGQPGLLPATFVNGYAGPAASLAEVLAGMLPGQTLQVFLHATARSRNGPSEQGWLLMTATRNMTGGFRVAISGSQQAGPFLRLPDVMNATDAQLLALLAGRKAHLIFNGLGAMEKGVAVTVEVSLYLVDGNDADRPPLNPVNPVARETFEASELASDLPATVGYDKDCDQAPEVDDMEPDGVAPPQIFGEPASPLRLTIGDTATLKVASNSEDVAFAWTASDPSLRLAAGAGDSHTINPRQAGVYRVVVTGEHEGAASRYVWDVLVDAPDTRQKNTPPEVKIASSVAVARVGEVVALLAVGRDKEQGALRFRWQASDPVVLPITHGPRVPFVAPAPGDYKIECVANDGMADSAPATLVITVLAETANRPPEAPAVTPLSALVPHPVGEPAKILLHARSVDPDGDPVTFDFAPDPSVSRAVTLEKKSASTAEVRSAVDGVFLFHVTAQDSHGATSPATVVRIQIVPAGSVGGEKVDNDRDGHPSGVDCNDSNNAIFPGARETCGDNVDQNCDGRDQPAEECDADGDRFTEDQGDCDDNDPRRNPKMFERCDGIDNNCDLQVDEGFQTGQPCHAGTGACRAAGTTRCSATLGAVVCDVQPGRPAMETCDGVDNDCNGRVDDVMVKSTGDVGSCGACGNACPQRANTVAACQVGGCSALCRLGFVDLDRDPTNGCECQISERGVEKCDGLDNDCNGRIDDNVTDKVYGGEESTRDVGVCASGVRICKGGELVEQRAPRLPGDEVCDGLDNDCNGKVDELFDLQNDARNCGGCGITCSSGVKCERGRCAGGGEPTLPLPPRSDGSGGQVQIGICPLAAGGTTCVDLQTDPVHCGTCGNACPTGMFCGLGACVSLDKLPDGTRPPAVVRASCPQAPPPTSGGDAGVGGCPVALPDACKGPAGDLYCTNLRFDNASCGACGVPCPAGAYCRDGRCSDPGSTEPGSPVPAPTCRQPFKLCTDPFGGTHCTDLATDVRNCGGCDIACGAGTRCLAGQCVTGEKPPEPTCPPPTSTCLGLQSEILCVDLARNPDNCGACGTGCAAGSFCKEGQCVAGTAPPPTCYKPMVTCKVETRVYCADTFRDPGNCGACGMTCPAGNYCGDGRCQSGAPPPPVCEEPRLSCKGPRDEPYCTDPFRDPTNCGTCGKACPLGSYCALGQCAGGAPPPPTCEKPNVICMDTRGGSSCSDPQRDPRNCGACGTICTAGTSCIEGRCQEGAPPPPVCEQPLTLCQDAAGGPGFCTLLLRDPRNCGECRNACQEGLVCTDGRCVDATTVCEKPLASCLDPAGKPICTDPLHDRRHCGGCNKACADTEACVEGKCGPPPGCLPPRLVCRIDPQRTVCTDPNQDPNNCGGCGNLCPAGRPCEAGRCLPLLP